MTLTTDPRNPELFPEQTWRWLQSGSYTTSFSSLENKQIETEQNAQAREH